GDAANAAFGRLVSGRNPASRSLHAPLTAHATASPLDDRAGQRWDGPVGNGDEKSPTPTQAHRESGWFDLHHAVVAADLHPRARREPRLLTHRLRHDDAACRIDGSGHGIEFTITRADRASRFILVQ